MFTGIVEEIGFVREAVQGHLVIEAGKISRGINRGDSVAVNGVCLTAVSLRDNRFETDVMPETLRSSNLGRVRYGDGVNMERAMVAGGRVGGHLVSGHVDAMGEVMEVMQEGNSKIVRVAIPTELMPYIANKGFVAIDGASLTVFAFDEFSCSVSLVAYTREHTILGTRKQGDLVNVEMDLMAKYIGRLININNSKQEISTFFLEKYGF